jgi:hypothetical protein
VLFIRALTEPDAQIREALLREAVAVGRRLGDPDIEVEALTFLGGLLVMTDRVEEGLVLFDEGQAANELTVTEWDPVSKQPLYKVAAVRVTKLAGEG